MLKNINFKERLMETFADLPRLKNIKFKERLWLTFVSFILLGVVTVALLFNLNLKPKISDYVELQAYEKLKELNEIAYNIISNNYTNYIDGILTEKKAKQNALAEIKNLRYGDNRNGYYWINDYDSNMLMHPMMTNLEGKNMKGASIDDEDRLVLAKDIGSKANTRMVTTNDDNELFLEFVKVSQIKEAGIIVGGVVYYKWPIPEKTEWVNKLSYVKAFDKWGWVIGTGEYSEEFVKGETELSDEIKFSIYILFATLVASIIAVMFTMMMPISKSLDEIVNVVSKYENYEFKERISIEQNDEIGILAKSLNNMMDAVKSLLKEIRISVTELGDTSTELLESQMDMNFTGKCDDDRTKIIHSLQKNISIIFDSSKELGTKFNKIDEPFKKLVDSSHKIWKFMIDVNKAINTSEGEDIEVDVDNIKDTMDELKSFKDELNLVKNTVEKTRKELDSFNNAVENVANNSDNMVKSAFNEYSCDEGIEGSTINAIRQVNVAVDDLVKMTQKFKV